MPRPHYIKGTGNRNLRRRTSPHDIQLENTYRSIISSIDENIATIPAYMIQNLRRDARRALMTNNEHALRAVQARVNIFSRFNNPGRIVPSISPRDIGFTVEPIQEGIVLPRSLPHAEAEWEFPQVHVRPYESSSHNSSDDSDSEIDSSLFNISSGSGLIHHIFRKFSHSHHL